MPIFDYKCPRCGNVQEEVVRVQDLHNEGVLCNYCTCVMERQLSSPNISMGPTGAFGFYDNTLGKYIGTKAEWKAECARQGVIPRGETPKPGGEYAEKRQKNMERPII